MKIEIGKEVLKVFYEYEKKQKLTLKEIYDSILEKYPDIIGKDRQYLNKDSFTAGVRGYIETHSSDSDAFNNNKGKDLFYSVLGKGKGVWGLRIENIEDAVEKQELEKRKLAKVRLTQPIFRNKLIKLFKCQCPISGVNIPSLLIASHIKPWAESSEIEKMEEDNGILLSVHIDALFDKGLISFSPDTGEIIYFNDQIKSLMNDKFKGFKSKIDEEFLTQKRREFLKWHIEYHNL